MNRAERLEAALRQIASVDVRYYVDAQHIAQVALDADYPWPGETEYIHPKDFAIARGWMERHARADEIVLIKGRPVIALYYEPVADHYQQARKLFREFAEKLRKTFEEGWV